MSSGGVKRKARYSIFSRREDGSLALGVLSVDDSRPPAPPGRPYRDGLLLMVTAVVMIMAVPKIFHISFSLSPGPLQPQVCAPFSAQVCAFVSTRVPGADPE